MRQGKNMAIYEVELPIENARKQKEQELMNRECIECAGMFNHTEHKSDVCIPCEERGRK
jgi:hypothetical protein